MAITIREYLGYEGIQVEWDNKKPASLSANESLQTSEPIAAGSLMVDIEGIHVGPTRNFTWYTEEGLRDCIPTWTKPYLRPLIMHHNEKDGKIIGRIRHAEYIDKNTKSGTGAILFTANVPDKEGKEAIKDGRLNTVSIGAIVHDCRCSICGANIAEMSEEELKYHEHQRGAEYDGKICYWLIKKMEAKELSYVIVPSDIYAQNVRIYNQGKENSIKENFEKGVLNVSEASKVDPKTGLPVVEGTEIVEDGDKGAVTPPAPPAEDYKAKYDALKLDYDKLVEDKKAVDAELEAKKGIITQVSKDLEDTKVLLETATKNLKKANDDLVVKEASVIQANNLREAAEGNAVELQKQIKENTIQTIVSLRESLGKPALDMSVLESRSDESLHDSLRDLKEEMSKPAGVTTITPAVNPSLSENTDENKVKDVKESKNASNMNLEESVEKFFSSLMGSKNIY